MSFTMPTQAPRWMTLGAGIILALSAFYRLALRGASPHPLPGLLAGSGLVFAAGLSFVLRAARKPRAEALTHFLALILGVLAIGDIALMVTRGNAMAAQSRQATAADERAAASAIPPRTITR